MKKLLRFLRKTFLILLVLAVIWAYNNYSLKVTEQTMQSSKITEEIKIVLVSDLHGDSFGIKNSSLIKLIGSQEPDLVFVLGDMYSRYATFRMDTAVDFCAALTGFAPVYFVSGDHDYADEYFTELREKGVTVLDFDSADITVNNQPLTVYGIRSEWFSPTFDLNNAFDPADESRVNILLAHCPYMEKYASFELDFVFSGDTHGGMLRLPLLGPVYYNGSIFPKFTYKGEMYDKGYYDVNGTQLFVTSGVGNYPLPLRFNNRPEIALIKLVPC